MKMWENSPASQQKNEPITVKPNNSSTSTNSSSTAPSWFKNSESAYAKRYADAPAVTGGGSSGGGSTPLGFNLSNPSVRNISDISTLMGGYNYDEGAIRALFDKATKGEYAAKRTANQGAQRQFATNTGNYITSLSDTMRQQLNQAVATGGSRGLAAAQAMQAAQDASLKTVDEATKLTEDAMALDYEEAAAYAENAKAAEALVASRKIDALNAATALYGYDVQKNAAELGALGNYYYGGDAAATNRLSNQDTITSNEGIAAADRTSRENIAKADRDAKSADTVLNVLGGLLQSNSITPQAYDEVAKLFGLPAGSIQKTPVTTSVGGYYGGGYNSGGGYSSGGYGNDRSFDNVPTAKKAFADYNKYLMAEDKSGAVGAIGVLSGWDAKLAEERYIQDKKAIYNKANEKGMTFNEFKTWIMNTYHGTEADAKKFWNAYASAKNKEQSAKTTTKAKPTNSGTNKPFMQQTIGESFQAGRQYISDVFAENRKDYYKK